MELAQQAFGDPRLAQALAQLDAQLQGAAPRRGLGRRRAGSAARTRWAWARPPGRWRSWASSTRWPSSSPRATRAPGWRTSTSTRWAEHLGDQARVDARALAELERELERAGPVRAGRRTGRCSCRPKALRRLGESALQRRRRPDRRPARRAGDPPLRCRGRAHRRHPAVGVRRHRGRGTCRARCSTPQLRRAGGDAAARSTSPTSRSSRPSSAAGRRWRCAWTPPGRWCRTGAGCR